LIDVGLSELFGDRHHKAMRSTSAAGSIGTMAPEVAMLDFSYKCDVWSIGCLLFAALKAEPEFIDTGLGDGKTVLYNYPFLPDAPTAADPQGLKSLVAYHKKGPNYSLLRCSMPAKNTIRKLLTFQEQKRPSAAECLELAWFKTADKRRSSVKLNAEQLSAIAKHRNKNFSIRAVLAQAASQMPTSKLQHLEHAFETLDVDHDGLIEVDDIRKELVEAGLSTEEAQLAAQALDANGSGKVDWSEFVAALLPAESSEDLDTALKLSFVHLDTDGDGSLDAKELESLLHAAGGSSAEAATTASALLKSMTKDGSSTVSYDKFREFLKAEVVDAKPSQDQDGK